jgi:hypothetical protein
LGSVPPQEVEDWYLDLFEREPGLVDKVNAGSGRADACGSHQGIDAPQLRNSDRRGAPPTSGSCSSSSETPSGASDGRRQCRELEGRYDTKIPIAEYRYGQWIKKQEDE